MQTTLTPARRNRVGTDEAPVFQCISMLATAVGQTLSKYMGALLDPMFACGLSESLTQALVDMAHYIHPIKPMIQEELLDLLSLVLAKRPFKPLGCPENKLPPIPAFAKDFNLQGSDHKEAEIALALGTLGSFDFAGVLFFEISSRRLRKANVQRSCLERVRARCCHTIC